MKKFLSFLTLFTSMSTLLCCALPALLVSLGLGAAFSSFLSQFPQLIWVSEHKTSVFMFSAVALAFGGWLQWRAQFEPCPIDPDLRKACLVSRKWSLRVYIFSLVLFLIGFFFAYLITLV